jgi:NADH dehydrogenase FAD-containing subunit
MTKRPLPAANDRSLRVILVGAGHAHLQLLREARGLQAVGVELCLVSPPIFYYSGLATGVLSGAVDPRTARVDVARLAKVQGVMFRTGVLMALDRRERRAMISNGEILSYDAISFNAGSTVADPHGLLDEPNVWGAKPLTELVDLRQALKSCMSILGCFPRVVVAGGGPTGYEIAGALASLWECAGLRPDLVIVSTEPVPSWTGGGKVLRDRLAARGVQITTGRVVARSPGVCHLEGGETIPCDALVLASGLVAADVMAGLRLPVDQAGRLKTLPTLQSVEDRRVFAVGDCAVIEAYPRPCVGVFGVRAARVLAANLAAMARGGPFTTFHPQRRWLSILDLGDGTGLALRGRAWAFGQIALRFKRWLDHRFVRRISRPPPASNSSEMLQHANDRACAAGE